MYFGEREWIKKEENDEQKVRDERRARRKLFRIRDSSKQIKF